MTVVRPMGPADVVGVQTLAQRVARLPDGFAVRQLEAVAQRRGIWVAARDGTVVGYAVAGQFAPGGSAPTGLYLLGLVVAPRCRRQGVGLDLTRKRVAWALALADVVYCFIDDANEASVNLHQAIGFRVLQRPFVYAKARNPAEPMTLYELRRGQA